MGGIGAASHAQIGRRVGFHGTAAILNKVLALLEAAHAQAVAQLLLAAERAVLEVHDVLETLARIVVADLLSRWSDLFNSSHCISCLLLFAHAYGVTRRRHHALTLDFGAANQIASSSGFDAGAGAAAAPFSASGAKTDADGVKVLLPWRSASARWITRWTRAMVAARSAARRYVSLMPSVPFVATRGHQMGLNKTSIELLDITPNLT